MDEHQPEAIQVPLLLRVGLGAVWVYEGLIPALLAPSPDLVAWVARGQPFPGDSAAIIKAAGVFEVLLGLLLVLGWMVRSVAAVQCGLLVALTIAIGLVAPQHLVHPMGTVSKHVTLFAAGLCLVLLGSGRDAPVRPPWREDTIPLILRLGLGIMWLYEGIVPKWLFPSPAAVEAVARTGLVPFHIPSFLRGLGVAEAALGLTILSGLWVRGLASLQVGLLSAFTAIIGWTSPESLRDSLGGLSKNLGLIGAALALHQAGSGPFALDTWLTRRHSWQRWRFLTTLRWTLVTEIASVEISRAQAQACADPNLRGLLEKLRLDDANHGEDLASLIRRHGGRPLPGAGLARGLAWGLGCLTVVLGTPISIRFDLWLKELRLDLYGRIGSLLPPEEGITARALQAMRGQEAEHARLLRDHLIAMRRAGRGRR